jgi:DNA-directed RNA polymerase beta' subunit
MRKNAGAGRGFVNPQRTDESDEDYVTPAQRSEMEKDLAMEREKANNEKMYNAASKMAKGGVTAKYMSFTKTGKPAGMRNVMAKGGSASSRADGIAQRGKTRGKMC